MIRIILFSFAFLFSISAFSQEPCGFNSDENYGKWWAQRAALVNSKANSIEADSLVYRIPVKFHVTGTDSGAGFFPDELTYNLLCELNKHFDSLNVQFYLFDSINHISNTSYHNFTGGYAIGNQMMNQYNVLNVCNIYILENPNGVCGYAYYPGSGPSNGLGGIALNKGCSGPGSTTLSHEVGHWLSLPHPFDSRSGIEFVNGTNCATAGDLFCDTRADYVNYRWSCPLTTTQLDPNGDLYQPDETLFMSYSLDRCQKRFSNLQKVAMRRSIVNDRPYLLNWPATSPIPMTQPLIAFPPDSAVNQNISNLVLSWNKVAGAQFYQLKATRFTVNAWPLNIFTTDTFFSVNTSPTIQANYWYRWKVKAYSMDNVCEEFTPEYTFKTIFSLGTESVVLKNINIYPTMVGKNELVNIVTDGTLNSTANISFYSIDGKLIHKYSGNLDSKMSFNLSDKASGLVLVHVQTANGYIVRKIVLQ